MQALQPEPSSIRINFGDKHQAHPPIQLALTLDFFSTEQSSLRAAFASDYQVQIPRTCFAFEFVVEKGTAKEKVAYLPKDREKFEFDHETPITISFHHHKNKVLCLMEVLQISQLLQKVETGFGELEKEAANESHQIYLKLTSHNDFEEIWQKLQKHGELAWIDSLHLEFKFVKTEIVTRFMIIFLQTILQLESLTLMVRSFKKLNLELNFASSAYLSQFPKVIQTGLSTDGHKERSAFVQVLLKAGMEKGRLFMFNPTLFLKGDVKLSGLITLLDIFFKHK